MTQVAARTLDDIDPVHATTEWLSRFAAALDSRDADALRPLFTEDAYWRDMVAFTAHVRPFQGRDLLVEQLVTLSEKVKPSNFTLSQEHTAPSVQPRGIIQVIESFFDFETADTNAKGVVRLVPADNDLGVAAVAVLSAAQELKGFEEPKGQRRREHAVPHQFSGPNWKEYIEELTAFENRDPEVVVVGAGQSGLTVAESLRSMGVDLLVLEKNERVGDNWRKRYHSLTLHNYLSMNNLPNMRFPSTWPEYLPKDKFGGWLEQYAESMEIPVWTSTDLVGGSRDAETGVWTLEIVRDGERRQIRTKHVVMATGGGICAHPNLPHVNGIERFTGKVLHSSEATDIADLTGDVLVFGTGTSAHDIASQLAESGANVTMVQRSVTNVVSQPTANLYLGLFLEREPEEVDLIFNANDKQATKDGFVAMTQIAAQLDKELIEKLNKVGFRTDDGIEDAGYFWNFLCKGGGYYINVGTSDLIIDGTIKLIQYDDIATFTENGIELADGTSVPASAAVFATGYGNQQEQVRELFGNEIAEEVGPIWGFDEDGEIRNTWRPTPVEGLWFVGGGITHARNYGRYVGLQLKARLLGRVEGQDINAATMWVS